MAQRDNRHFLRCLACTPCDQWPSGPLSDAAKHPAGARPSKCIIIILIIIKNFLIYVDEKP
jgi:hypothetical protein